MGSGDDHRCVNDARLVQSPIRAYISIEVAILCVPFDVKSDTALYVVNLVALIQNELLNCLLLRLSRVLIGHDGENRFDLSIVATFSPTELAKFSVQSDCYKALATARSEDVCPGELETLEHSQDFLEFLGVRRSQDLRSVTCFAQIVLTANARRNGRQVALGEIHSDGL